MCCELQLFEKKGGEDMRWEVSYNTNERSLQKMVVEARSADEAKQKVAAIAKAQSKATTFTIRFNGIRVV